MHGTPASLPLVAMALTVEGDRELYFACKRLIDVATTITLLVLLFPLMLLIAVLIRLDTPGPAVFVQQRVGARRRSERGRTTWEIRSFSFYKFRTMAHNVDQSIHRQYIRAFVQGDVTPVEGGSARFKIADDPRVTRIGRILRRTSLDELPQLLNVLKGEMSLVGPRPVPTYEVAEYQEADTWRLAALPGITGIWQVKGRAGVPFAEMVQMDREYVRTQSLWLDFRLLLATLPAVLAGRGAQ